MQEVKTMARVLLDAGHYGKYNRSPVVPQYYESDFTWQYHLLLKAELEKLGIEVGTTRPDQNTDARLFDRGAMGEGYDLFISLHSDASTSARTDRVNVYHLMQTGDVHEEASAEFAALIAPIVSKVMGCKDKCKTLTRAGNDTDGDGEPNEYYGVLRGADSVECPAVIIEHSYHTNQRATLWLMDDDNLAALALVVAETIADFLGVAPITGLKGDINGDGVVDAVDYMMLKRIIHGTYEPTEEQRERCDINGDSVLDVKDYESLRRYVLTGSW